MSWFALLMLVAQAATSTPAAPPPASVPAYVPERVFDTRKNAFADFEVMLADLATADVIFVGEQHDDPNTHRLELGMLEGLRRRRVPVIVSLEMFERDVQPAVDRYLSGAMVEAEFLTDARPWPRYATDYRPLIELARAHGWPVLAANVPRRFASEVAKSGKPALDRLSSGDRAHAARELECPRDAYFDRFAAAMGNHSTPGSKPAEPAPVTDEAKRADTTERYYWSQCMKDETMAESIAAAFDRRPGQQGTIVHFNGAFHSDFGAGTAERTRRRLAGRRVAVVTILPVTSVDALTPSVEDLKRADYLVYTVKEPSEIKKPK
jgi:uncharacterized iron-regulated protein